MKEKTELVCVYTDEAHEKRTKVELEAARQSLTKLVSMWADLRLGPVADIYQLLMQPQKAYKLAVDLMAIVPETGTPFRMKKSAFQETLDLPDPQPLYSFASKIRQQPWCVSEELWSVDVDGRVVLDEKEAASVIASQSIWAVSPAAITLAQDLKKFVDLFNSLNARLGGELISPSDSFLNRWATDKFKITGYPPEVGRIELRPEPMKRWLSKV